MARKLPDFLASLPWEPILGYRVRANGSRLLVCHRAGDDKGLFTVAPNRSGKGVSVIGINAICHRASLVIFDPKSEMVTKGFAWWRAVILGQRVFVFDPLREVPDACIPPMVQAAGPITIDRAGIASIQAPCLRAGFNPIEMIAKARNPVPFAKAVAAAFVPIQGDNPFWSQSAQSFFAAYLCFVALDPDYDRPRTMRSAWHDLVLSNITPPALDKKGSKAPQSEFDALLDMMSVSPAAYPFVRAEAIDFKTGAVDTVQGYRKTLKTQVGRILDDPDILESLSYTSLDFGLLQREHISIFLCLPGWAQDIYANFFRVLLSCMFIGIEQHGLGKEREPDKTLIIMDEFASMGKANFIREAIPRLPGYGVRFWPFVQDLNQLQENFGNGWQTFLGQAGTIQVFGGATDNFTAEYLSKMSGTYGERTTSETDQVKGGGGSRTTGTTGRPALFPYEITSLNAEPGTELRQILFYGGKGFAYAERLRYFVDFPAFVAFQKRLNLPDPSPRPAEMKTASPAGRWRPVGPSEIFPPGGRYRIDPNGEALVWTGEPG